MPPPAYRLQNRYQDSRWEDLGESYPTEAAASYRAFRLSANGICYGMVRVVAPDGRVVVEFPAR